MTRDINKITENEITQKRKTERRQFFAQKPLDEDVCCSIHINLVALN
jgi:hypothetical protein